jgi:hypothetical protein
MVVRAADDPSDESMGYLQPKAANEIGDGMSPRVQVIPGRTARGKFKNDHLKSPPGFPLSQSIT